MHTGFQWEGVDWVNLDQDTEKWQAVVIRVMNPFFIECKEFDEL